MFHFPRASIFLHVDAEVTLSAVCPGAVGTLLAASAALAIHRQSLVLLLLLHPFLGGSWPEYDGRLNERRRKYQINGSSLLAIQRTLLEKQYNKQFHEKISSGKSEQSFVIYPFFKCQYTLSRLRLPF